MAWKACGSVSGVCACGTARPSGPLGKHLLSWWLQTKEQGKGQEEKQEETKSSKTKPKQDSGLIGTVEGEADGQAAEEVKEALEAAVGGPRPSS